MIHSELQALENTRVSSLVKQDPIDKKKSKSSSTASVPPMWSSKEIQTLIRGVFRFGENEWYDLLLDGEDENGFQSGGFAFHPLRIANELALKWRQIKAIMMKDIKKIRIQTKGEKIITKHEWMVGALEILETLDRKSASTQENRERLGHSEDAALFDEETPQMLYEALFIDPSKLTPYQHAQLEYQRHQHLKELQASHNNLAKKTLNASRGITTKGLSSSSAMTNSLLETIQNQTGILPMKSSIDFGVEESKEGQKQQQLDGRAISSPIIKIPSQSPLADSTKAVFDIKEYAPHILESMNLKLSRPGSIVGGQQ